MMYTAAMLFLSFTQHDRLMEFYDGVTKTLSVCGGVSVQVVYRIRTEKKKKKIKIQNIYFVDHFNLHLYLTIQAINNDSHRSKKEKLCEKRKKEEGKTLRAGVKNH